MPGNFKERLFNFRGVKKEEMQRRSEMRMQSMTVGAHRQKYYTCAQHKRRRFYRYVCLQMDELYEEVLYEIVHSLGAEKNFFQLDALVEFAREAFKIEQDVHDAIYRTVKKKEVSCHFQVHNRTIKPLRQGQYLTALEYSFYIFNILF